MRYFLKYLKTVFIDKWWIYIAFVPNIVSFIQTYFSKDFVFQFPLVYSVILFAFLLLIANCVAWLELYNPMERPRIVIDYDLDSFNICFLVIKNIGTQHARNVEIKFRPDIKIIDNNEKMLNERSFMSQAFVTIGGQSRFLFGSFLEENEETSIRRNFEVEIEYWDQDLHRKYKEKQIIDPRQFLETSPKHPINYNLEKELKEIGKKLDHIAKNNER